MNVIPMRVLMSSQGCKCLRRHFRCLALAGWQWPFRLAQQQAPHIGYVYPAGGRQGTTFQVTVGGQFLDGVTACMSFRPAAFRPRWSKQQAATRQQMKPCGENK